MSPEDCPAARHGDATAYQAYGCRCDDARAAQARYRKQLRYRHHRGIPTKVAVFRVRRRIEALMALGWPRHAIYTELGYSPGTWIEDADNVSAETFAKVAATYDRLSMQLGPSQWTRTWSRNRGYAPPLAWDDIDDPDEQPKGHLATTDTLDDVAIDRRIAGDRVPLTTAEKAEARRRWVAAGRPLNELERVTGINTHRRYEEAS